jgi:hypothetical protein
MHRLNSEPHSRVWVSSFNAAVDGSQLFYAAMNNTDKFEDHHEGWRTLWLAIAGVVAITLTWNVLMLSLNGISY